MADTNSFFSQKRAWSAIKDEVLRAYLTPYLAKVSRTRHPIIIADCFAGKGRFDDGSPGSPLIIAEAICHQLDTDATSKIKAIFIEKKYFADLQANVPKKPFFTTLEGDFEDRVEFFINNYSPRNQNLLLYVDPYGIKSILFSYFDRINKKGFNSVELLLNLNTLGFLREGCRLLKAPDSEKEAPEFYEQDVNSPERLDEIAGGNYWRDIVEMYRSGQIKMQEAEKRFIAEYREKLRSVFRYVINIPIKTKLHTIPKYHIVYGTNHADGLLLMVDNMHKRWANFRDEARNHQSALFEFDFPDSTIQKDCWHIDEKILSHLDQETDLKMLLIALAQELGISFPTSEYKEVLKKMEKDGVIDVKRDPPKTATGRASSSWDHTRNDFSVKISRRGTWQQSLL